MAWTEQAFKHLIERLRENENDFTDIEVKRAAGGPPNVKETLCAFGNMPEGGTLVLGVDESNGFSITGVQDPSLAEQAIASQARTAVTPAVAVNFQRFLVDGKPVVLANIKPVPSSARPCTLTGSGYAYSRFADGDYRLSEAEIHQLLARRDRPRSDAEPVPETDSSLLDPILTEKFLSSIRASSSRRLAQLTDEEILRAKRVIEPQGKRLTVAGIYALGNYPQQFAPSLSLTAVSHTSDDPAIRNADRKEFDGPLPELLDEALRWVSRNTRTAIRFGSDGHGFDDFELPLIAVRELIANALVHRDLSPHSMSKDVQLHLYNDRLIIMNPGGLWGLTTTQLERTGEKSAVNEFLYEICKHVRTENGNRLIEGEGGGLREVRSSLRKAGMAPARFYDTSVRFTVNLPRHALISGSDLEWLRQLPQNDELTDLQRQVLVSMRHGQTWTNQGLRTEFAPLDSTEARTALQGLAVFGLAEVRGAGRSTTYAIANEYQKEMPREPRIVKADPPESPTLPFAVDTTHKEAASPRVTKNAEKLLKSLRAGPASALQLAKSTQLSAAQIQYALRPLLKSQEVLRSGGQGHRNTTYRLGPEAKIQGPRISD